MGGGGAVRDGKQRRRGAWRDEDRDTGDEGRMGGCVGEYERDAKKIS